MEKILLSVKKELRPDNAIIKKIDELVDNINYLLKKHKVKAICVKGGSTAKGTFLKDDYDVDLFVRFDYSYRKKNLSDILEEVLKNDFSFERVHGSRDYFQIFNGSLLVEIVPVLKVTDYKKAVNITDMSPLHVDYVKKKVSEKQKDDIRLAKQFCKAAKVYGAESYINGFSGHILDLLIIHYGSFEKLLKAAVSWKSKVVIDLENHLEHPLEELNSSKTHSPLIIVDPVQPDRNAAAALNKEKFDRFIETCNSFLKKPSKDAFKVKLISKDELKKGLKLNEELFFINADPLKGKKDVVGAKLLKAFKFLKRGLKKNDFEVLSSGWDFNKKAVFYFIIAKHKMSDTVILPGPPTSEKVGVKRFKDKHSKTFVKDDRVYAEEPRKFKVAVALVHHLLQEKYVVERVKKISFS